MKNIIAVLITIILPFVGYLFLVLFFWIFSPEGTTYAEVGRHDILASTYGMLTVAYYMMSGLVYQALGGE